MLQAPGEVGYLLGQVSALIMLVSGAQKLLRPRGEFSETLYEHRLIPAKIQGLVAGIVPAVELSFGVGGILLAWSKLHVFAMSGIASLYALYALYLGILIYSGHRGDCGCVSGTLTETDPVGATHVARAVVLALFAITAVRSALAPSTPLTTLLAFTTSSSAALVLIMLPTFLRVEKMVAPLLTEMRGGTR